MMNTTTRSPEIPHAPLISHYLVSLIEVYHSLVNKKASLNKWFSFGRPAHYDPSFRFLFFEEFSAVGKTIVEKEYRG